ncbi:MAG: MBL fold metallo-hydrolase [Rhizobiales bacterium]|nr:hypothetical protein [Rhodobiaceae bacterium]MBL6624075.1 MBL fold metallo-hydrolase [Hyphomicrobiales bacterium]MBL6770056.1 MBL fold metallo-hydrolase [Hyphomicrobiales bacterium]RPF97274.1 MAG: hypothetical protein CBD87_002530 [Rhizobiales bacterium TMED227]
MEDHIIELSPNKAFSLQNIVKLDGRLSAYPPDEDGYVPLNCYLVKEEKGAFLFDTGYVFHQDNILTQLNSILDKNTPLSIIPLRINEFMSVGNAKAISHNFNVISYYSPHPEASDWFDFTDKERDLSLKEIPTNLLRGTVTCEVGEGSGRNIQVISAPLRLINTSWIYDEQTKILFSSDMFNYGIARSDQEEWIIKQNDPNITKGVVRSFLLNTRYWWLEGAKTRLLRDNIRKVYDTYDIEIIAPGYGKIFQGKDLVKQQFELLDDILNDLDVSNTEAKYVPRNYMR